MIMVLHTKGRKHIMAKRPPLTDKSFLASLFSPKKNPLPAGIRKTTLKGLKGGRKASRLAAFNRMSPKSQETLKQAGLRDAYLTGNATLTDAKKTLRPRAIAFGVARPTKAAAAKGKTIRTGLDKMIAEHLKRTVRAAGRPVNTSTVDAEIVWLGDNADEGMLKWGYGQIKHAGRKGSEYEQRDEFGKIHNPLWYH